MEKNRFILIDCVNNNKIYFEINENTREISTHRGNIKVEDIINSEWGSVVRTHLGHSYRLTYVDLHDFIMYGLKRKTQIIYPKDSAFICSYLNIKNGDRIFECGCGSGALTLMLANMVSPDGEVICYERKNKFIELARNNLNFNNLINYATIKEKDLEIEDIEEINFDAAFIDVKEPWKIVEKVSNVLKNGKKMGILVPTFNQVIIVLEKLKKIKHYDIELKEILIRDFKTLPERVRPEDRMIAHTGFLIFSRKGV